MKVARDFVTRYLECGATQYGGMVAYSLFVSLVPVALGVLSIFGLVARNPRRFNAARNLVVDIFPPDVQGPVRETLVAAGQHALPVILLSLVGLAWFSTGLFSTTGFALNRIHGYPNRAFWQQRLRGLSLAAAMVVAIAFALAIEFAIRLAGLPRPLGLAGIFLALAMLVLFMYRHAPGRMLSRSQLWPGAVVAAFAIVLFGYGLTLTTDLTLHLASDTRFFAEVFALAAWVYFIAQAILFGAVVNSYLIELGVTPGRRRSSR